MMIQDFFGNRFKQIFRLEQEKKEEKKNVCFESKKTSCSDIETKIPEIPPELLQNIFIFLNKQDKFITSLVSKPWRVNTICAANREFPHFSETVLQYHDFIKCLASYVNERDMEKLLMIKDKFENYSSFPQFLMPEMRKNLEEILKTMLLEQLGELKKSVPKLFLKFVIVEFVDKQINNYREKELDRKLFTRSLSELMVFGELNKALDYLKKVNISDKNIVLFGCIRYLLRHERNKVAIRIINSPGFKKDKTKYVNYIFSSIKDTRLALRCASLLKSPHFQETALRVIHNKMGSPPISFEPGITGILEMAGFFPGFLPLHKNLLISICVKLAETDIDQAKTIVSDMAPGIREEVLSEMVKILKSLNQIDAANEIMELLS